MNDKQFWSPTMALRWHKSEGRSYKELQQLWVGGEEYGEWRRIPDVQSESKSNPEQAES